MDKNTQIPHPHPLRLSYFYFCKGACWASLF
jgi:hypothetical protein